MSVNGIEIEYEVSGSGPPLLLVMGLAGQLTDWPPSLVEQLGAHFTVVTFDNRDAGLSTYSDAPIPTRRQIARAALLGSAPAAPYTLSHMADDAAGVLSGLNLGPAHIVGISMGGMIAQELTLRHPMLVRSLCSIMSSTGDWRTGRPTLRVLFELMRRGEPDRAEALGAVLDLLELVGGADWDREEHRQRTIDSIARAYNPAGVLRQTFAVTASPKRTNRLRSIKVPTLVIHGLDDTLVRPTGGVATADAIPDSRLLMFPGMGHDLPATRHDELVEAILHNSRRAHPPG